MIKEFNSLNEIKKYYDEKTNTYIFKEDGSYIDSIVFNFDLDVLVNIEACDIKANNIYANNIRAFNIKANNIDAMNIEACEINASDIRANNINAWNIYAKNITYYAVCYAYNNIKCKSIKGRRANSKHFVLDGTLEVIE